jgi:hypothetical protein
MNATGTKPATRRALATLALTCATAIGCGGGGATTTAVDGSKVRTMAAFYEAYLSDHNGQPPKDEAAFREFLTSKQSDLEEFGMTVDEMFASPRGSGSIVWVYGRRPPAGPSGRSYVGYEASSIEGKRLVLAMRGMYDELDDAEFKKVFPNAA